MDIDKHLRNSIGIQGQDSWLSCEAMNPRDYAGFVYLIVNLENNKRYIGLKQYKNLGKKTIKVNGKRKANPNYLRESSWKDYYGSSKKLQADIDKLGKDNFERIMISQHATKRELQNAEANLQHKLDVLTATDAEGNYLYYNEFIGKAFRMRKKNEEQT